MDKQIGFLYRDSVKKALWFALIAVSIVSVILEFLFLHRHSHFAKSGIQSIDGIFGFYGLAGLFGCLILILISQILGSVLKVDGDYYNDDF